MKLGFDIDGIVADMPREMVKHINEKYNLNHTIEIFTGHSVHHNVYVDDPELNAEIAESIRENVIYNDDTISRIRVYRDAKEAIQKLHKAGHSIHFITYRPRSQERATVDWIRKKKIPFDTVHVVGKTGLHDKKSYSGRGKGPVARALNLDFFIDDHHDNLEEMYRYKNRWRKGVALFTRPWNAQAAIDMSKFLRFDKWNQVIRHLGIHKR